jgi:orotidine-5'-phosphate decarboxylase
MGSGLIIALDYDNRVDALTLVEQLDPKTCALKIGSEMFTRFGPDFVKNLVSQGFPIFLDLKFHDIPNTVAKACKAAADLGVWMLNVHASGGLEMMRAAKKALEPFGEDAPLLIAVTILTSMSEQELSKLGITIPMIAQVCNLAVLAEKAGLDGVVCSAHEVGLIKANCQAQFITVTPGIRLAQNATDDQTRIMTPQQAVAAGSDYLVMGRPITGAANPKEMVLNVLEMIR